MYADDIILLSIAVNDLQLMLNKCTVMFSDLDLPINTAKSHCLRIGPRCHSQCSTLLLNESSVPWVESISFLGVTICRAVSFKCCWSDAKRKFYCSANTIIGRLGTSAPVGVLLKLINSHSVPHLLYGTSATSLSETDIRSLCYAYNSVFAKLFKTSNTETISCCQFFTGNLCFKMLYHMQRYCFLAKLMTQKLLDNRCKIDIPDYTEFHAIQCLFNLSSYDSRNRLKFKMFETFNHSIDL